MKFATEIKHLQLDFTYYRINTPSNLSIAGIYEFALWQTGPKYFSGASEVTLVFRGVHTASASVFFCAVFSPYFRLLYYILLYM